jgi:hypothetical protein
MVLTKNLLSIGVKDMPTKKSEPNFINKGSYSFVDISTEEYREYVFDNKIKVRIENPLKLAISATGHRVFSADGISHYIPFGWVHLSWKAKPGCPHFVK